MAGEKAKMSAGKKVVIGIILILSVLTTGVYFFGVYYFTNHFLPGSVVGSWNCSYMTVDETEELLSRQTAAYVLAVETRGGGREAITEEESGLIYVSDGSVKKLMKEQDRFKWFLAFQQSSSYEMPLSASFDDKEKLKNAVQSLKCMQPENITEPLDAHIADNGSQFEIVPETQGNAPDRKKTMVAIRKAVSELVQTVNLEEQGCYQEPAVLRDDEKLNRDCEQMNRLTDTVITYDFADRTEVLDRDTLKDWLIRDSEGEYTIDRTRVAAYVNDLGYKYDTFGCTRNFRTYNGRQITISGGDYGWAIAQDAETEALMQALLNGETQVREPVYAYTAWSRDTNDIGYTYIEIDLASQRLVFYKDGQPVVDTAVVTGNPNIDGNGTPSGCFAVDAMKSPAVLTGEDYEANVTYWMPFCKNVGIHDAPWRTEFGGNLYLLEGSHGCVNVPYDQAQIIYNNIGVGAPVIVY